VVVYLYIFVSSNVTVKNFRLEEERRRLLCFSYFAKTLRLNYICH